VSTSQNFWTPPQDKGGAPSIARDEAATVPSAETSLAGPTRWGLEIISGEQYLSPIDYCLKSAVPPGLTGKRSDLEPVFVPTPSSLSWPKLIGHDRSAWDQNFKPWVPTCHTLSNKPTKRISKNEWLLDS
jgi:hypothetical protein